jgi:hypothetical protein
MPFTLCVVNGWRQVMDERSGETYFVCDSCGEEDGKEHRDDCELMAFLKHSRERRHRKGSRR